MKHKLSHLDESAQPRMVDVSAKDVTTRVATAEAIIQFPDEAWQHLESTGFNSKKGPILEVARIAGTMAIKRTSELIPFCHPLPIDGCSFEINRNPGERSLTIQCTVKTTARTGVEMEALQGASTAALTVYDMTKSLGHGIKIEQLKLLAKTGGKADYKAK